MFSDSCSHCLPVMFLIQKAALGPCDTRLAARRAPMSFFHTTPLGRIINRLTKDTVDADKNLADFAAFFLRSMLQLISTIVLIGIVVPLALPALLPIMLFFYLLYAYFQARASLHPFQKSAITLSGLSVSSALCTMLPEALADE